MKDRFKSFHTVSKRSLLQPDAKVKQVNSLHVTFSNANQSTTSNLNTSNNIVTSKRNK